MRKGQRTYASTKSVVEDLTERMTAKRSKANATYWLNDIDEAAVMRLHKAITDRLGQTRFLALLEHAACQSGIHNCRKLAEAIGHDHPMAKKEAWFSAYNTLTK